MTQFIDRVLRNLSWFERLFSVPATPLPDARDMENLIGQPDHLFLGFYDEQMLTERLEHYGILGKLREQGIDDLSVKLDTHDPEHQVMRLFSDQGEHPQLLGEAIYHIGAFRTRAPFARMLHGHRFNMLFIQWMLLQNPFEPFSERRPQLPGQNHPGLHIGREIIATLQAILERLQFDGILVSPEFAHNALMYRPYFQYVSPITQGRMTALRRDLADLTLAEAAWGIELGCIRDKNTEEIFRWVHDEMCLPRHPRLKTFFSSAAFQRQVEQTAEKTQFFFDRRLFEHLYPERDTLEAGDSNPADGE